MKKLRKYFQRLQLRRELKEAIRFATLNYGAIPDMNMTKYSPAIFFPDGRVRQHPNEYLTEEVASMFAAEAIRTRDIKTLMRFQ